jgi:enoyl-CoA hydratase/carnithine racemase
MADDVGGALRDADFKEGVRAFLETRKPAGQGH